MIGNKSSLKNVEYESTTACRDFNVIEITWSIEFHDGHVETAKSCCSYLISSLGDKRVIDEREYILSNIHLFIDSLTCPVFKCLPSDNLRFSEETVLQYTYSGYHL